jgi:hypothetical protein
MIGVGFDGKAARGCVRLSEAALASLDRRHCVIVKVD